MKLKLCLPSLWWETYCFCPVRHTVCQRNSSETTEQNFMKLVYILMSFDFPFVRLLGVR